MYKCCWGNTLPNTHPLAPLKKVSSHPFSVAARAGSGSVGAGQPLAGRHAALPAPLTQRRRSDARRRHPRLRRRELHAARAAARSRWTRCGTATAHPLPPFEHQPADTQATATHRARAAPPQEPARGQQRPPSTPSRSTTSREELLSARSRPAPRARQPADSHARAFRRDAAAVHSESS